MRNVPSAMEAAPKSSSAASRSASISLSRASRRLSCSVMVGIRSSSSSPFKACHQDPFHFLYAIQAQNHISTHSFFGETFLLLEFSFKTHLLLGGRGGGSSLRFRFLILALVPVVLSVSTTSHTPGVASICKVMTTHTALILLILVVELASGRRTNRWREIGRVYG